MNLNLYLRKILTRAKWQIGFSRINKKLILANNQSINNGNNANTSNPNKKLRVLFFSHNLSLEGSNISLFELIIGIKQKENLEISVMSPKHGDLWNWYLNRNINVKISPYYVENIFSSKQLLEVVENLKCDIEEISPDLVFINTLMSFPVIIAAKELGIKSILNVREGENYKDIYKHFPKNIAMKALMYFFYPQKVIFVSDYSSNKWLSFNLNRNYLVIKNSIDPKRFEFNPILKSKHCLSLRNSNSMVILSVGTFCKRKGQLQLLKVIKNIENKLNKPIKLIFLGDYENRYGIKSLKFAKEFFKYNQNIEIEFMGIEQDIGEIYRKTNLFIQNSREESCSRTVLEAIYFNLKIISSDIKANVEILSSYSRVNFFKSKSNREFSTCLLNEINDFDFLETKEVLNKEIFIDKFNNMVEKYIKVINS